MQRKRGIRIRKRRVIFLTAVLLLIAFSLTTIRIIGLLNSLQLEEAAADSLQEFQETETVNFLLTGLDSRGEGKLFLEQLVLVNYNPSTQRAFLIFIPRETQVYLKDYGIEKVGNIYGLDSSPQRLPLLIEAVSELMNAPIHYFMEFDYRGLSQAVKSVRGVEVDVKETLTYDHRVVFPRGEYLVKEDEAYRYFTFSEEGEESLARFERQRLFMAALTQKVMNKNYFTGLPGTISRISSLVSTNMSWREILHYYDLFQQLPYSERVTAETLPGREEDIEGEQYWVVDREEADAILREISTGEAVSDEKRITLEILNGKGEAGIANRLSRVLKGLGYEVVRATNAENFNYKSTLVISRAENMEEAARALVDIIPGSEFELEIMEEYPTQITIIIGHNFDEKELTERLR